MESPDIEWLTPKDYTAPELLRLWKMEDSFPFDPSFGYSAEALLNISSLPELPEGGEAFWRRRYETALSISPEIKKIGEERQSDKGTLQQIELNTTDQRRISGWLALPKEGQPESLTVHGHGYGNPGTPEVWPERKASLFFHARGLGDSKMEDIPSTTAFHVLNGIESKEAYVHGGCAEDLWCSVTALRSLFPDLSIPLFYEGGSFGGGIGALAIPWDSRIQKAFLRVPSFGNYPLRLTLPCTGSGEAVRQKWLKYPEILENTLRWHDAAATIRYAKQPILFICALQDPAVPPPGQFSVWKAHGGPSKLLIAPAGHTEYPGLQGVLDTMNQRVADFLK